MKHEKLPCIFFLHVTDLILSSYVFAMVVYMYSAVVVVRCMPPCLRDW